MDTVVEALDGQVKVNFGQPVAGKLTFKELGIEAMSTKGGFLRLVFDFEGIGDHHYYQMPTVEVTYDKEVGETHWQCDFNEETILDKLDHHGHSTVILMNRKKLSSLEHHHQNKLTVHGEFPEEVMIDTEKSFVNFFN